jgi:hypothetical protein
MQNLVGNMFGGGMPGAAAGPSNPEPSQGPGFDHVFQS